MVLRSLVLSQSAWKEKAPPSRSVWARLDLENAQTVNLLKGLGLGSGQEQKLGARYPSDIFESSGRMPRVENSSHALGTSNAQALWRGHP